MGKVQNIDFNLECPPVIYLEQVLDHCKNSSTAQLYMQIWRERNKESKTVIYKEDIKSKFFRGMAKFKNDLLLLVKEGLVNVDETPNAIHIELVDFDEDAA